MPSVEFGTTVEAPDAPKELLGICEFTEHETDIELEAVGLDKDGSVKPIKDLSYNPKPGEDDGFGADFISGEDLDTADEKTLFKLSVFRWYRVKDKQPIFKWPAPGKDPMIDPDTGRGPLRRLHELLPISATRITLVDEIGPDVVRRTTRVPASIRGDFTLDIEFTAKLNARDQAVSDAFDIDEVTGIVHFQKPIFKWSSQDAAGVPVPAVLKLRCTVFSSRYTKTKDIGGNFGTLTVRCANIGRQYIEKTQIGVIKTEGANNESDVDAKVDAILDRKAREFQMEFRGYAKYIGMQPAELDGKINQITWSVDSSGAFTSVSANSEHHIGVPIARERRRRERSRTPISKGLRHKGFKYFGLPFSESEASGGV